MPQENKRQEAGTSAFVLLPTHPQVQMIIKSYIKCKVRTMRVNKLWKQKSKNDKRPIQVSERETRQLLVKVQSRLLLKTAVKKIKMATNKRTTYLN